MLWCYMQEKIIIKVKMYIYINSTCYNNMIDFNRYFRLNSIYLHPIKNESLNFIHLNIRNFRKTLITFYLALNSYIIN